MAFSVEPLIIFAQKRQETLDIKASIIPTIQADGVYDGVTTGAMSTRLLLVTKYGLRLQVSHDGTVEISYIPDPQLKGKSIHGDIDGCNLKQLALDTDTPSSDPERSPPFSYKFLFDLGTTHLWYKDFPYGPDVDEDLLEARYPRLAKTYSEWLDYYENSFNNPHCYGLDTEMEEFPEADEDLAWHIEGFLLACWLALQDDVREVQTQCEGYHLQKGRLEEELVRYLMALENLKVKTESSVE